MAVFGTELVKPTGEFSVCERRGIGVRVKGVTGRDAIVTQLFTKGNAVVPIKSWLSGTSPCFSGFRGAAIALGVQSSAFLLLIKNCFFSWVLGPQNCISGPKLAKSPENA